MIVNAEHKNMFIAHHDEGDAYACIDACVDKLERQLTEHKKKHRNRKHPDAAPASAAGSAVTKSCQCVSGRSLAGTATARLATGNWQLTTDN